MPVATKAGLNDSEIKMPANKHNIQTGNSAPAMLITGLHPEIESKETARTKWPIRKLVASVFRPPMALPAKMHERIV